MLFLQTWRFVTLLLATLLTGMTFCHVLEMPAKMLYPVQMYLTLHRTLYAAFGPPNVGPIIELGTVLTTVVLVFLLRRRSGFWPTLIAAASFLAGLAMYFVLVEPANAALKAMSIEAPPQDWTVWRDQWELGHSVHFFFDLLGMCALIVSVLPATATLRVPMTATGYAERAPRRH